MVTLLEAGAHPHKTFVHEGKNMTACGFAYQSKLPNYATAVRWFCEKHPEKKKLFNEALPYQWCPTCQKRVKPTPKCKKCKGLTEQQLELIIKFD
jgi:hypothetical protein